MGITKTVLDPLGPAHQTLFLLTPGWNCVDKFSVYVLLTCAGGAIPSELEANGRLSRARRPSQGDHADFSQQTWVQIQLSHLVYGALGKIQVPSELQSYRSSDGFPSLCLAELSWD